MTLFRAMKSFLTKPLLAGVVSGIIASIRYTCCPSESRTQQILSNGRFSTDSFDSERIRGEVRDANAEPARAIADNPHGKSAAARKTASLIVDAIKRETGLELHCYQMSKNEQRRGLVGCREYYWAKDLNADLRMPIKWWHWLYTPARQMPCHCLVSIVDVDYYLDLEEMLSRYPNVYCLYTFELDRVVNGEGDLVWTFNEDNDMVCCTAGGGGGKGPRASYKHRLHNFNSDTIIAHSGWFSGNSKIPQLPMITVYSVVKKKIECPGCVGRALVVLIPLSSYCWPDTITASNLQGQRLEQLSPVDNGFLRMEIMTPDGLHSSIATVNGHCCLTAPKHFIDSLMSMDALQPKTGSSTVKSLLDHPKGECATLAHFIRSKTGHKLPPIVYTAHDAIRRIQHHHYDPEASCNMHAFAGCLVDGAYAFDVTKGNVAQAVWGRILKYRLRDPVLPMNNFQWQVVDEYANLILERWRAAGHERLKPLTVEELTDKLTKSAQLRDLAKLLGEGDTWSDEREFQSYCAEMMMKREMYNKLTDPRCITQYQPRCKFTCLCYAYPLMDLLKETLPGMCSGRTSDYVAGAVTAMCSRAESHAVEGDMERMDGTYTEISRKASETCTTCWFDPKYTTELKSMEKDQYDVLVRTAFSLCYSLEYALGSGSGETTPRNNITTGLIYYLAYRTWNRGGSFIQPEKAAVMLDENTIWSGDDSGAIDVPIKKLQSAASCLGMIMKGREVRLWEPGFQFLARDYTSEVFSGNPNSCASLPRQLPKFFCCVNADVDREQMSVLKALSYYITDSMTPVLGELCEKILTLSGGVIDSTSEITVKLPKHVVVSNVPYSVQADIVDEWNGQIKISIDPEKQYPNLKHDDFYTTLNDGGALEEFDTEAFQTWLDSCNSLEQLLDTVPVCCHFESKHPLHAHHIDGVPYGSPELSEPALVWTEQGPEIKRYYRDAAKKRLRLEDEEPKSDIGRSLRPEAPIGNPGKESTKRSKDKRSQPKKKEESKKAAPVKGKGGNHGKKNTNKTNPRPAKGKGKGKKGK